MPPIVPAIAFAKKSEIQLQDIESDLDAYEGQLEVSGLRDSL